MTLKVNVKKCARCEMDHDQLEFTPLTRPMVVEFHGTSVSYQWWAWCPTNGEPIVMYTELSKLAPAAEG